MNKPHEPTEDRPAGCLNAYDFGASGSSLEVHGQATAGSCRVILDEPGDFQTGQGVALTRCNPHTIQATLWGPHQAGSSARQIDTEVEYRGYDGTAGSWVVLMLDVDPDCPEVFRWTDDLGRTWHENVPMSFDWQMLSDGFEVRFHPFAWEEGWTAVFSASDQLITEVSAVEGNVLTLKDVANRTCACVVRHNDSAALQRGIDAALAAGKNLYVPNGHYRLADTLFVENAESFTLLGERAERTVFDNAPGIEGIRKSGETRMENSLFGPCLALLNGTEVNIKNLTLQGGMGFSERDQAGLIDTRGGTHIWGMYFKRSYGIRTKDTERVLIENCHARRMSTEAFYSQGSHRTPDGEPAHYTRSITYLRCSVEDCARNAFNNNDKAENTALINCRIRDVGGCSWEGASRFVRMTGCYVRNAGTVAMGNVRSRDESYEKLGSGQHIIADNVFESSCPYGGYMIRAGACATQIIIRNNLFVNFNSSAIQIMGDTGERDLPPENAIITGNSIDLTAEEGPSQPRTAISITAQDVTVSDNQIFVRGQTDEQVTGIALRDDALRVIVHDNLLRGCGIGITSERVYGAVGNILDEKSFTRLSPAWGGTPSYLRRRSHRYAGWHLVWLGDDGTDTDVSIVDAFDPENRVFHLRSPRIMKPGERFCLYNPEGTFWNLHDNMIYGSSRPLALDSFGRTGASVRNNLT